MKKIFIDRDEDFQLIDVDGLHFFSNICNGTIYASHSLQAKAGVDICKIHIAQYTYSAQKQIMKKLFEIFVEQLGRCKEVLTIHDTSYGGVIFKDGDILLYEFNPSQVQLKTSKSYGGYKSSRFNTRQIHQQSDTSKRSNVSFPPLQE